MSDNVRCPSSIPTLIISLLTHLEYFCMTRPSPTQTQTQVWVWLVLRLFCVPHQTLVQKQEYNSTRGNEASGGFCENLLAVKKVNLPFSSWHHLLWDEIPWTASAIEQPVRDLTNTGRWKKTLVFDSIIESFTPPNLNPVSQLLITQNHNFSHFLFPFKLSLESEES